MSKLRNDSYYNTQETEIKDISTIAGLGLGVFVVLTALIYCQAPLETILRPDALLIVFGGTFAATLVSHSWPQVLNAVAALRRCFYIERYDTIATVDYLTDTAMYVRSNGILALQNILYQIDIPFLRKGVQLLIDNRTEAFTHHSLATDIEVSYRQDMDEARIFEAAGGFAPTMGLIGAVIGLIHTTTLFQNPAQLGNGVASAFSATLYGVALSNLFLLPLAGKLRQGARERWFQKTLLLEGIISIQSGDHPMITEEKLCAFIQEIPREITRPAISNTSENYLIDHALEHNDTYFDHDDNNDHSKELALSHSGVSRGINLNLLQ